MQLKRFEGHVAHMGAASNQLEHNYQLAVTVPTLAWTCSHSKGCLSPVHKEQEHRPYHRQCGILARACNKQADAKQGDSHPGCMIRSDRLQTSSLSQAHVKRIVMD